MPGSHRRHSLNFASLCTTFANKLIRKMSLDRLNDDNIQRIIESTSILCLRGVSKRLLRLANRLSSRLSLDIMQHRRHVQEGLHLDWFRGDVCIRFSVDTTALVLNFFNAALPNARLAVDFTDCYNLTDAGAASLAGCPSLQSVDFTSCRNLTDAEAASLAACPSLLSVNFTNCDNLTDAAAASLAACPRLQSVDFERCGNLTAAATASLAACQRLQSVNFAYSRNLTHAAAASLAACRSLEIRSVDFTRCRNLTDAAAASLTACPSLRSVEFKGCGNVSHAARLRWQ